MFKIYIAKAAENFGVAATRPIYEQALEVLPDRQTAEMCLRFAALERKLGEIDRARAVYAHASQFCDPRVSPGFWSAWNAFEIATGSEDTFREMLRIKRSVQAQFNTEASYLAAQALAAKGQDLGDSHASASSAAADPMAAVEKQASAGRGLAFVAATKTAVHSEDKEEAPVPEVADANADEIHISDDDDDL
jgi:pre-mRNA-splicing factor SYF1